MPATPDPSIRVGVDIGGTFTDVALTHAGGVSTGKVLTSHGQPEQAIIDAIRMAADDAGIALGRIGQVIHGTTLVTNALIERRGARLAFVTTEGFRDVIEMRSESRFEQYDLNIVLPPPLVSREHRFTVNERVAADGSVLLALDASEAEALAERIIESGYEAVAIGLMHGYANPAHEQLMEAAFRKLAPELPVAISSVIAPQMREYERFNTVIANAFVQPQMAGYLGRLVQRLRREGIEAPVFMMHSGGGLISIETASIEPVRLLESGPAGGAILAADLATTHGIDKCLSLDMGGTTAKICLIENGQPKTASRLEVARSDRFKKGSGMPVSTPVVEMVEIGAGGGSIASVDAMGRIQVGPQSAGSEPGPACYKRGGEEPTVTDANLALGRLDPENFSGGKIPLSEARAATALESRLGNPLDLPIADAAFGVTEMVDENMANATRVHAVENGRDIAQFTMIAFGGGAPLHACRLCEKLGIDRLIIPPGAGVGSAIGFLKAPFSYEATRGLFMRLGDFDAEAVNAAVSAMETEARAFVAEGAGDQATDIKLTAQMRYVGQGWEIPVTLDHLEFADTDVPMIRAAFEDAYRTLFGRIIDDLEVEITNWSLSVASRLPDRAPLRTLGMSRKFEGLETRSFFDAALRKDVDAQVIERTAMTAGTRVDGPAAIIEDETSTIVTSAFFAIGQSDGSILVQRKGDVS